MYHPPIKTLLNPGFKRVLCFCGQSPGFPKPEWGMQACHAGGVCQIASENSSDGGMSARTCSMKLWASDPGTSSEAMKNEVS